MNNRWKDLAEQCMNQRLDGLHFDKEMFAELIVRQCAEICLEANDHKNILRYFGVEND